MKKVIRLTESDLVRLVKRVIKEQDEQDDYDYYYAHSKYSRPKKDQGFSKLDRKWYDRKGIPSDPDDFDEKDKVEGYFDYDDFDSAHPGVGERLYGHNPHDGFKQYRDMDNVDANPLIVRRHKRKKLD